MIISWHSSVLIGIATTLAVIAPASSVPEQVSVVDYLTNFGYLSSPTSGNANSLVHNSSLTEAIKDFQSFFGLTVTGNDDDETLQAMAKPRCGFRDKNGSGSDNRTQSYTLRNRWNKKALTYRISLYTKKLSQDKVDSEIARAFAVWSEYTDFTFTAEDWGPVDIEIKFLEGWHGYNCEAFEGLNGVLAHAAFPYSGGFAHFDDAEPWTIGSPRGTNLFQIAAHEFGHSLGLDHSDVKSALMSPWPLMQYDPYFKLDSDDVEGIQKLYGKKRNKNRGGGPTPGGHIPYTPQEPTFGPPMMPYMPQQPTFQPPMVPSYYPNGWNPQKPKNYEEDRWGSSFEPPMMPYIPQQPVFQLPMVPSYYPNSWNPQEVNVEDRYDEYEDERPIFTSRRRG